MKLVFSLLIAFTVTFFSSNPISENVQIRIFTYEKDGVVQATAMPEMKTNSNISIYNRRFEYVLINHASIHQPENAELRKEIWSVYPDTVALKTNYLKQFSTDSALLQYFTEMKDAIEAPTDDKTTYTQEEMMDVASKFFYCDKVNADSSVQAHVCVGINGIKEANWSKDYTLLSAFCYEAIFVNFDREDSPIWDTFSQLKETATQQHLSLYTNPENFLEQVKLTLFESMKNDENFRSEMVAYYQLNKSNLAFSIEL